MKRYIKSAVKSLSEELSEASPYYKGQLVERITSPRELQTLASLDDDTVIAALAENPNAPPDVLIDILSNPDQYDSVIVQRAAANPQLPEDTIRELSSTRNWDIRRGLARNPNISKDMLKKFVKSKNALLRAAAMGNPNIPTEWLQKALDDEVPHVRCSAGSTLYDRGLLADGELARLHGWRY